MSNTPNNEIPDDQENNNDSEDHGTIDPLAFSGSELELSEPTAEIADSDERPNENQVKTERLEDIEPVDSKTELVPPDAGSNADSDTVMYDDSASGSGPAPGSGPFSGSGSGADSKGPKGSNERLQREWDSAIGSSGKGSGESLRFERPEASDSVLERVALRTVADANISQADRAQFDYAIQDKIGEGGMGLVFSAIQTAVNRTVALKTLKKDKGNDAAAYKQFFYEAEITADLDHPNIPPIYELGSTADGTYFYTMKRIKGSEWQRMMAKRGLEDNLEVFRKLGDAIGFAHSKQILHLDIKPENVIVGGYGEVYVTDWGLAHNLSKKIPIRCGGTPDYMAPEMARKEIAKIGKQTDIYLLGAVLFHIVTGKPPHAGAETKDRKKAAYSKLVDAYHNKIRATDVDSPLLAVAMKAMSTNPSERYATVEDMQSAVHEIVQENANIKTSIELTKSSKTDAQLADKSQDYERFNRAIFGFRNAIEVWTGNKEAEEELKKARLAFGQCAFNKGDYDLALQTLDRKVPDEATLLDKAQKAKTAVLNRESRLKTLRNVVFGLLGLGAVAATGAALVFNNLFIAAQEAQRKEEAERKNAEIAKLKAEEEERKAKLAQQKEETERKNAEIAKLKAEEEERKAKLAQQNEEKERKNAEIAKLKAEEEERKAKLAQENEEKERKKALARLAQVTVGDKLTNLGFASAQTDKANPIGAATLLNLAQQVDEQTKQAFGEKPVPQFVNWASRRIELLSNKALRPQELAGQVTAIDFAKGRNRGVAGLSDGRVVDLELRDGKLIELSSKMIPDSQSIVGVSISPSGDEAMLAAGSKLYRWVLEGDLEPMQEEVTQNRSFQRFAYSPDGSMVVAGIRGGLWIKKSGSDWQELTPLVKGRLLDADWLGDRGVLVLADNNDNDGDRNLHFVPVTSGAKPAVVVRGCGFTQLGVLDGDVGKLVIASDGGALATYDFDTSSNTLTNPQPLTRQHRNNVTQIDIDPSAKRMVTGSGEAVVHVWKYLPNSREVAYETFLTGTPGTSEENVIERTAIIDGNHVVNVDKAGSAVALNIDRQMQRRELTREASPGVVPTIFPRIESSKVLAVDANGVVDQWDLVTGETIPLAGQNPDQVAARYSYFGHTPGASLFDTAIDAEQGVVITSAVIPSNTKALQYAGGLDPSKAWAEFCVWDQASGNMLRRWQGVLGELSSPPEPRLTLLGDGTFYVGSSTNPKGYNYQGRELPELKDGFKAAFTVVNPLQPLLVAIFKPSSGGGTGGLWDRVSDRIPKLADDLLEFSKGAPVHAAWSSDGQRLYVLDASGTVTGFVITREGGNRNLKRETTTSLKLKPEFLNAMRSFQNVELEVESRGSVDRVVCNIRDLSSKKATTTTSVLNFQALDGKAVGLVENTTQDGLFWLQDKPGFKAEPQRQVLSKLRAGNKLYVTINDRVYGAGEPGSKLVTYGRKTMVMSTADRKGERLVSLQEDGSLLILELSDPNQSSWKRLEYGLGAQETRISLSPDGKQLAVYNAEQKSLRVLAADSGAEDPKGMRDNIWEFCWDPAQDAKLVTLTMEASGEGILKLEGEETTFPKLKLASLRPKAIGFFNEQWIDKEATRYFVVHAEEQDGNGNGKLFFVPRDGNNDENNVSSIEPKDLGRKVELAISPTESILATGDETGTIRIWFASPSYNILREVYDLSRDGQSAIQAIVFSGDGDTLVASDKRRVSAWMSQDKLVPELPAKPAQP